MTQETLEHKDNPVLFVSTPRQALILIAALAGVILGAMVMIGWVQQTVSPYHPLAFEDAARQALEEGNFERAATICTGNLHYSGNRFPSFGVAHLLRAKAYLGQQNPEAATEELAIAEAYWRFAFRRAEGSNREELAEFATDMAMAALGSGEPEQALRLFSLAGTGSGTPLQYLEDITAKLTPQMVETVWPAERLLIVEDFARSDDTLFTTWTERTGRSIEIEHHREGTAASPATHIVAGPAVENGLSWYGIPFYMQIPEQPCRFRATITVKQGPPPRLLLGHFYPDTERSDVTIGASPAQSTGQRYDVEAVLPGRAGDLPTGVLVRIGLALPPESVEYFVERIDILPLSEEGAPTNG